MKKKINKKGYLNSKNKKIFQIDRDQIHDAIRIGNHKLVQDIGNKSKRGKFAILGKNKYGRCSIHIAVLCQQKEIMDYLAGKFSECLRIGDNVINL